MRKVISYMLIFDRYFNIVLCLRAGQDETPGERPSSSIVDDNASFCQSSISFLPSLSFMFTQLPLSLERFRLFSLSMQGSFFQQNWSFVVYSQLL